MTSVVAAAGYMPEGVKRALKVVDPQRGALEAPPAFVACSKAIDYACGGCGIVLLHAKEAQIHGLVIRCRDCGAHNGTG